MKKILKVDPNHLRMKTLMTLKASQKEQTIMK